MTTIGSPVHPDVTRAMEMAHNALRDQDIPHLLIGGLAVCARGYPYATADVDFLLPEGAFPSSGLMVTIPAGIPWRVGAVQVDYLFPPPGPFLEEFNDLFLRVGLAKQIPVVPAHLLAFLKLRAGRARDSAAITELIKRGGLDPDDTLHRFLEAGVSQELVTRFTHCAHRAREEAP